MILLQLNGEKAVGVYSDISPSYQPKDNEVLVDELPIVEVAEDERGYIYYRNGKVEIEIRKREV